MVQIYPGTSQVAQNRRNFCNPEHELEKLREISDEDVVKILAHKAPGEEYKSVHPPLDEMDEPDDSVRELVAPIDGAKAGDRIRYIQFVDSMYFAPAQPYLRARSYLSRYRGIDTGTLSGRQVIEARERDIERLSKYADKIGLAFQIKDDILSEEGDSKITGKPVGNDKEMGKCTYVSYYGLDGAKQELDKITKEAIDELEIYGEKAEFLKQLAMYIRDRNK